MLTELPVVVQAATCFLAVDLLGELGIEVGASKREIARRFRLARSYIYDTSPEVVALLSATAHDAQRVDDGREHHKLQVRVAVDDYRFEHPGCWASGGRSSYSRGLQRFILNLAEQYQGQLTQAAFAQACRIPLPTFKDWIRAPWAQSCIASDEPARSPSNDDGSAETSSSSAESTPQADPPSSASTDKSSSSSSSLTTQGGEHHPANATTESCEEMTDLESRALNADADDDSLDYSGVRLSLQVARIIREYNQWNGTFTAFVRHIQQDLKLFFGKALVRALLHIADERHILRRKPPGANTRGSTFRPPANVQWSTDGKTCTIVVDGVSYKVNWQPMMDVGSAAIVGSVVRKEEDSAGVIESFNEGVETTGTAPGFLLADNKAPNKSEELNNALPDETTLMHATIARPENKAVSEGNFGLFAQGLGSVIAILDTTTPESLVRTAADAITRAFSAGRNGRPRRKDGRTPAEALLDNASPEDLAKAFERILAIKNRIDARRTRQEARRDPVIAATLEQAYQRFDFTADGNVFDSLFAFSLPAIQNAVAIYSSKQKADRLPDDAGMRYFYGIVRNCQYEIDLRLFEQELVAQLESTGQFVTDYLERRAALFERHDLAGRLAAITNELLVVPNPIAQTFWRHQLYSAASMVPRDRRPAARARLCKQITSRIKLTKADRQSLIDLVVRGLHAEPPPAAA